MKLCSKLFKLPYLYFLIIVIAITFGIYYYNADPLNLSLDTQGHKLKNYIKPDKVLVVSFWASWCGHCMNEVHVLNQLHQQHPELDILGLQVDDGIPGKIFQNNKYHSLQSSQNSTQIMQIYGNYTGGVPFILILWNNHHQIFLGETSITELEQAIQAILKQIENPMKQRAKPPTDGRQ